MIKNQVFDAFKTQLMIGSNLIEASAGTGKTFAIAMLVVRFIVEKNIKINEIIVTTFTKAATVELKDRIRARIHEALLLTKNNAEQVQDKDLKTWFEELDHSIKQTAQDRLTHALLDMDQAAIFTIHGFCQRMLSDFALEGGQLFNVNLIENIDDIFQQIAEDYWRKNLYYADEFVINTMMQDYREPAALLKSIRNAYMVEHVFPKLDDINDFNLHQLETYLAAALKKILLFSSILDEHNQAYFKKAEWPTYQSVMKHPRSLVDHTELFTEQGLFNALNGVKLRGAKKQKFIDDYQLDFNAFETLHQFLAKAKKDILLKHRLSLLRMLKHEVPKRLSANNEISFDDIITALAAAILGDDAELIVNIKYRYKAALIDEFQDTDKYQWDIFSNLFMGENTHYLYLIGDPKQAIYKFRGADIFTYLEVARQVNQKYTLAKNWRSHPGIVQGVNILFEQMEKPFVIDQFKFDSVLGAKSKSDGQIVVEDDQSLPPIKIWFNQDKKNIFQIISDEIVSLLSDSYKIKKKDQSQPIKASDIAILVESRNKANLYREALQKANIPVVSGRAVSVFKSVDAQHLLKILKSICYPNNIIYAKTMLSIDYFDLNGISFYRDYIQTEDKFDLLLSRLESYHTMWLENGLMYMMQQFLISEEINQNILNLKYFERRLTDFFHLIELTQQAIITENLSIFKTLEWLQNKISDSNENQNNDEQKIRLDSEREAVTIVTMHSSKGLEYPIIFCPDLVTPSKHRDKTFLNFNQTGLGQVVDIGSDQFDENFKQVAIENLSEKMRLLYVALTRAKFRCYLIWEQAGDKAELNYTNHSAFSYLLGLKYRNDDVLIRRKLVDFVEQYPDIFECCDVKESINRVYRPEEKSFKSTSHLSMNLTRKKLTKSVNDSWQMTSYTALSRLSEANSQNELSYPILRADDEALFLDNDHSKLKMQFNEEDNFSDSEFLFYPDIPKGAIAGNLIHALLEKFSFFALAQEKYTDGMIEKIKKLYEHYLISEDSLDQMQSLLQTVVTTPITALQNYSLSQLIYKKTLREMPFYLSISKFNTFGINKILSQEKTFQILEHREIEGLLTGFIDLIFVCHGKYYLVDYKSNTLEHYDAASITDAMQSHNYGLQLWIYAVVLQRFLEQLLPDYCYEKYFGGAFCFFVRGMNHADENSGIYFERLEEKKLKQLDNLLTCKERA